MPEVTQVRVPGLGEFADVEVVEVAVSAGDEVAANDPLITLETDKAAMDVPSPGDGRILSLKVGLGDRVNEGDVIAELEGETGSAAEQEPAPSSEQSSAGSAPAAAAQPRRATVAPAAPAAAQQTAAASGALPPIDEEGFSKAHASPAVRKFARELGVNLAAVTGSGERGRIRKADVKAWVKLALERGAPGAGLPQVPEVDFAAHGEIEVAPLGRVQKISGPRLWASWVNIPHVTQHDEADITEVEARRKAMKAELAAKGVRLTLLAFVARATVLCLKEFPVLNASLVESGASLVESGASLALKKYVHLGFAADTERGLLVPVIRNADKLDIAGLAQAFEALSGKAREGKLAPDEMQGGSFTISSLGGIGGTAFTPVINAPEVAILGVSRARMAPVFIDGEFQPRLMAPLSLSYDHRVIDGATAVRFTTRLCALLADAERLLAPVTNDTSVTRH